MYRPDPPPVPVLKNPDEIVPGLLNRPGPPVWISGMNTEADGAAHVDRNRVSGPPMVNVSNGSDGSMYRFGTVIGAVT